MTCFRKMFFWLCLYRWKFQRGVINKAVIPVSVVETKILLRWYLFLRRKLWWRLMVTVSLDWRNTEVSRTPPWYEINFDRPCRGYINNCLQNFTFCNLYELTRGFWSCLHEWTIIYGPSVIQRKHLTTVVLILGIRWWTHTHEGEWERQRMWNLAEVKVRMELVCSINFWIYFIKFAKS